jgi:serine/threonine protein kinase/alpha-tubulin suppressor-like RCC1 family protein
MSDQERAIPTLGGLGDQYEIVRELGRGGTAVVYLGRDRDLGRDVAIKVIRSTFVEDEEAMARLVREARTVAGLQHPNIVMLYGTHKLEDGSLALVMQYVPGRSLKDLIRSGGPLTYAQAGQILVDVARALTYAHRRRIVHRDIKPENIYIDDEAGVARLSDFGIARPWDTDSSLTLPGMALGTPAYMSPEQIDGRKLDGRSDLYSLGLVGYEMLTGRQPWSGENLYTVIYRQKQDQLQQLHEIRPDIPPHLQRAVEVALMKTMDDRWTSADDFIRQIQSGPLPATPPPPELVEWLAQDTSSDVSEDAATVMYRRTSDEELEPADGDSVAVASRDGGVGPPTPDGGPVRRAPRRRRVMAVGTAGVALLATVAWVLSRAGTGADAGAAPPGTGLTVAAEPVSESGEVAVGGSEPDGALPIGDPTEPIDANPTPLGAASGSERPVVIPAALRPFSGDEQETDPGTMVPNPLVVRAVDAFGAPVEGAVIRFTIESGGGFVSPDSVVSDESGLALTQWMLGMDEGEQSVLVSAVGFEGVATRFRANLAAEEPVVASAARAAVVAGADQSAPVGSALADAVVVEVADENGEPMSGIPVRIDVSEGGGSVTPATAVTDGAGRVDLQWVLGPSSPDNVLRIVVEGLEDRPLTVSARGLPPTLRIRRATVAGGTHTCAVTGDGTAYCWGGNDNGQLGDGNTTRRSAPGPVDGPLSLAVISAGVTHTCGVAPDGTAHCWGSNESGQLGDGTASGHAEPRPVAGGMRFTSVAAGVSHTCALTAGGQAFCWGGNVNGQLGDGTRAGRSTPGQVAGSQRFSAIAVGWTHTCGLTRSGAAYCWGRNAHGQLGDGTGLDRMEPTRVSGVPAFRSISAGSAHTCGVDTDGEAHCWGQNTYGQLGDGTSQNRTAPVQVGRLADVGSIVAGGVHTCATTRSGAAYCWGRNTYGQLGDGTTSDRMDPVPVSGDQNFVALSASGAHTCGETRTGRSYCWGYNVDGQLGDGSRDNRPVPTQVFRLPR